MNNLPVSSIEEQLNYYLSKVGRKSTKELDYGLINSLFLMMRDDFMSEKLPLEDLCYLSVPLIQQLTILKNMNTKLWGVLLDAGELPWYLRHAHHDTCADVIIRMLRNIINY